MAVIGASADPSKTAGRPVAYLQKHGYTGHIMPVNPKVAQINGLSCYSSIAELPAAPDVAIVLLAGHRVAPALAELAQKGTAYAIVLAGGFAETGAQGADRQRALKASLGRMRLLGPNTIGLVNVTHRISLSASGALETSGQQAGPIGLVSQSGGILGSILSRGMALGLGFSALVSTGNEADLELSDFIDTLVDDPSTRVIALYLETIRDPVAFRHACARATVAGKPVVAFKVGRSEPGALAASSHTGALAGSDATYDALFESTGVIRANQFTDLLDISATLLSARRLRGRRIAILTSTGGAGTLVADSLGVAGFDVPAPDPGLAKALRDLQRDDSAPLDRNPIDVTLAGLDPTLLRGIIRAVLENPGYDGLIVIVGSSSLAMPSLVADAIADSLPHTDKPILAYVSPHAPPILKALNERHIPALTTPEACAAACRALLPRGPRLTKPLKRAGPSPLRPTQVTHLTEKEAADRLAAGGIAFAPSSVVHTPEQARQACEAMGGRVVLKALSRTLTHKSDVGAVVLDQTTETIEQALLTMQQKLTALPGVELEGFLVQQQWSADWELIVGARRDPLGVVVLVGTGGQLTEWMADTALALLGPDETLSSEGALALLQRTRAWQLMQGYRGRPALDVQAAVQAIVAFSEMVATMAEAIEAVEINPLLVLPKGQGVIAVDAVLTQSTS